MRKPVDEIVWKKGLQIALKSWIIIKEYRAQILNFKRGGRKRPERKLRTLTHIPDAGNAAVGIIFGETKGDIRPI